MDFNISYQNRHRSIKAESYLLEQLEKIKPIVETNISATAGVAVDDDGDNVIHLNLHGKKHHRSFVSAKDESLFKAIFIACNKLKRIVLKKKNKIKHKEQWQKTGKYFAMQPMATQEEYVEPEYILKSEKVMQENKKRLKLVSSNRQPSHHAQASKSPELRDDLSFIPNLGPARINAIKKTLGISSIDDLELAAAHSKLSHIPGIGKKLEKKILTAIQNKKAPVAI